MLAIESPKNDEDNMALLNRCMTQDPDAYTELFARYNRRIFNTAYRILGEESSAEDALQETLLNVYRGISNFRGDSKISTWISRITINVCLGMLRKGKSWQHVDIDDEADAAGVVLAVGAPAGIHAVRPPPPSIPCALGHPGSFPLS